MPCGIAVCCLVPTCKMAFFLRSIRTVLTGCASMFTPLCLTHDRNQTFVTLVVIYCHKLWLGWVLGTPWPWVLTSIKNSESGYFSDSRGNFATSFQKRNWTEMAMIRWMCDVKVTDRFACSEWRQRLGTVDIITVVPWHRLRWYGHVLRKDENDWVKKCMDCEVEGVRPRGRRKKKGWGYRKRLTDPTNMQGRCCGQ